ncbi:MAG: hypothetical protein M1274_08855 [Actinobacteria bacterium]|nr:hypothetical protein [Actinomycetota bacterium]
MDGSAIMRTLRIDTIGSGIARLELLRYGPGGPSGSAQVLGGEAIKRRALSGFNDVALRLTHIAVLGWAREGLVDSF